MFYTVQIHILTRDKILKESIQQQALLGHDLSCKCLKLHVLYTDIYLATIDYYSKSPPQQALLEPFKPIIKLILVNAEVL